MTDQEILTKTIQKAIDNGWKGTPWMPLGGDWLGDPPKWEVKRPFSDAMIIYTTGGVNCIEIHINTEHIIFNHDFAKALWGELKLGDVKVMVDENAPPGMIYGMPAAPPTAKEIWQYHLQKMVIADDPIKYLGENL